MKPDKRLVNELLKAAKSQKSSVLFKDTPSGQWADQMAKSLLENTQFNQFTERDWQLDDLSEALLYLQTTYHRLQPKHHWSHFFALRISS